MKDISKKTQKELTTEIVALSAKQREARFGSAGAQSKNTKGIRTMRRTVARMKTALRASQLAAAKKNA
jgi:ribosomal protein L29